MSEAIRQMLDKNLEVVLEFLMPVRLISEIGRAHV